MFKFHTYSVESVTSGHPDKICDQVSDAILDACLAQDPKSRVAIEVLGSHGLLVIGGEVTTHADFDAGNIARKLYQNIGYQDKLKIIVKIAKQSPDIAMGVDTGGAGDPGIMYGYATDETPQFLPQAIVYAHQLIQGLETLRKTGKLPWLGPDGKAQVTMKNSHVDTVLVSCQHNKQASLDQVRTAITRWLIKPTIKGNGYKILVNLTGKFVLGGFLADTGVTGRKTHAVQGGEVVSGVGQFADLGRNEDQ